MNDWIAGLQPRERITLIIGTVVLCLFLFYAGIWEPLSGNVSRLESRVAEKEALVAWMKTTAEEINKLSHNTGSVQKVSSSQSLLSLIDSTAKRGKLGQGLKRVKPDGENKVSVWLDTVVFDDVVVWLESLRRQYSVEIESMIIDRKDDPGKVDARVVLTGMN